MSIVVTMKEDALVQFKLMLPASLKRALEERAHTNRRALSQEMVAILEQSLPAARDRLRKTHALADLAALAEEFEGEEGDLVRRLVLRKMDQEISEIEKLRSTLETLQLEALRGEKSKDS
ncbi:hypothetical protein KM176_17305 [Pseudooceanicola sp. CBS1P-1]|uniref:Arc family DNA-binding protein n=1 Tax=Pseudooceanicola albus TaxID=2692189 RepID=A0A6L7G642_9RHOB|nr:MULTISPECIES: hypothetical protein [Pseudooceanicola]MBT9385632.1 hypothetical protein [Pseudooceanicola endophyticus]MXN18958.1 hypothetical protein [Pseudooceanicola albus]